MVTRKWTYNPYCGLVKAFDVMEAKPNLSLALGHTVYPAAREISSVRSAGGGGVVAIDSTDNDDDRPRKLPPRAKVGIAWRTSHIMGR